ncbi:MAG: hypothetical protein H7256_09255 [Bdellovibrio sp.]|nr:hypothetical protein [Bdellovibrio sp.]
MPGFKFLGLMILFCLSIQSHAAPIAGKYFDRAMFVIFENTNYATAMQQPFFKQLAGQGAQFTNFMAITHPSQGNYIALTSGSQNGVTNDKSIDIDVHHIADLLEAKGLTWKVYVEDFPGNCFTASSKAGYARKHNPFISYLNVQKNPNRCANITNVAQFDTDLKNGTLPNYIFYVPNIKNDGHDTGVAYADKWFQKTFTPYLNNADFMKNTILISTFDESGASAKNQIYTTIVGPAVKAISVSDNLSQYSLLSMIEDNWNLGNLGKADATAPALNMIWK